MRNTRERVDLSRLRTVFDFEWTVQPLNANASHELDISNLESVGQDFTIEGGQNTTLRMKVYSLRLLSQT